MIGRLGAGALFTPLALLIAAAPTGSAAAAGRPVRMRALPRWDDGSPAWTSQAGAPAAILPRVRRSPAVLATARRTAIVRRMFVAGDRIARLPYRWGGGHGSFADTGYDCSGSVSYVLHAAGLLGAPEASGALTGYGEPGPGHRVTVYANAQHALVTVDGRRFDTISLRRTGSRWSPGSGSLAGYVARHPTGL